MNLPFFVARRLSLNSQKSFSAFIIRIALIAVSLSVCVMIIGTAITRGYQEVITEKFYACWGQIHVTNFMPDPANLLNDEKISYDPKLHQDLQQTPGVGSVIPYRIQSALIKTPSEIEGIVLKGYPPEEIKKQMAPFLKSGKLIQTGKSSYSDQVLISSTLSRLLNLNVGDQIFLYFVKTDAIQPKIRKIRVQGIYATGLEDFDKTMVICAGALLKAVNDETEELIQGYEINIQNEKRVLPIRDYIDEHLSKAPLQTYSIQERFSNVFSWLNMMKMNEKIILFIMMIIAIINMITAILILIMERTRMVGVFKAMGMPHFAIQRIFIYACMYIVFLGILIGTIMGVGICLLQQKFGLFTLDESTYYVKTVPVSIHPGNLLFITGLTASVCFLLLIIPSFIIRHISPVKAIRFD